MARSAGPTEARKIIQDIHIGTCGMHSGSRDVATKALHMGYYWPTVNHDIEAELKTCQECRAYARIQQALKHDLISITASWPFLQWGFDICAPFPAITAY
ncbi:reverse transcriptase domain-containing protein [Tanacetum coccineum]